jgi:hypothetical protein
MNDDGKFQDFAEVWVGANRSRARILMRYVSIGAAALVKRWEQHAERAADRYRHGRTWRSQKGPFAQAASERGQDLPGAAQ